MSECLIIDPTGKHYQNERKGQVENCYVFDQFDLAERARDSWEERGIMTARIYPRAMKADGLSFRVWVLIVRRKAARQ